jgi:hypothetical protein
MTIFYLCRDVFWSFPRCMLWACDINLRAHAERYCVLSCAISHWARLWSAEWKATRSHRQSQSLHIHLAVCVSSHIYIHVPDIIFILFICVPLWSSGHSSWLLAQRYRVRFPALPDFLSSSGSGKGSTQHREDKWGATWKKSSGSGLENCD